MSFASAIECLANLTAFALLRMSAGCRKKEETRTVPPGFCQRLAECEVIAERQQSFQNRLRAELSCKGVRNEYLACGTYRSAQAANGNWTVLLDTTGCPTMAARQVPSVQNGKKSRH